DFPGVAAEAEEPVMVEKLSAPGQDQGFLGLAGLGTADLGDDEAAVHHPGQAQETVVHLVPGVDALRGFFDEHPTLAEEADAPTAEVIPGFFGEVGQVLPSGAVLAGAAGKEFTHGADPVLPVKGAAPPALRSAQRKRPRRPAGLRGLSSVREFQALSNRAANCGYTRASFSFTGP